MKTRLILLLIALLLIVAASVAQAQSGGGYELVQSNLTAGGEASGGGYDLAFTLGQADAGVQTGGGYELGGGFWGGGEVATPEVTPTPPAGGPALYLPLILSSR